MKKFLALLGTLTLAMALGAALCACGGGEGNKKSDEKKSDNSSRSNDEARTTTVDPAFDISGDWQATMDGHELGTILFRMQPDGEFTGVLDIFSESAGTLEGSLSGYDAEWTMRYQSLSYLGSVTFDTSEKKGVGHLVDGKGTAHELVLTR